MTVTSVTKDPEALTMTVVSELDATVERAWQLWADPRQLERWWGPPTYPATVVDHIAPHKGDPALFYNYSNTQSLCVGHHNKAKQIIELGGKPPKLRRIDPETGWSY